MIAGLRWSFRTAPDSAFSLEIGESYGTFESPKQEPDIVARFGSRPHLEPATGPILLDSGMNWRLRRERAAFAFELHHPPSGQTFCRATVDEDFRCAEVVFDEGAWGSLAGRRPDETGARSTRGIPHPLEQLLLIPPLARRDGFLVHAAAAVVGGRAMVFAGRSGEGKTTLCRILAEEGVEILSDERIAIRRLDGALMAFGTPWPGEGGLASACGRPLGGIFLLRKSAGHRLRVGRRANLVAEIVSRSLVPYHFPEEATRVLAVMEEVAANVALGELEFSLASGLQPILSLLDNPVVRA